MHRFVTSVIMIAGLTALPLVARADDAMPSSELGPAASSNQGASSADAGALQPATSSTLQLAPTTSTSQLSSPSDAAGTLQQPATTSNQGLSVLLGGEADGTTNQPSGKTNWPWYLLSAGIVALLAGASIYLTERLSRRPV